MIVDETDPVGDIELSFPYRDVTIKRGVDAKECYELIEEIGRGKFGTVYNCEEKSTGLKLAAKFIPIPKRDDRRNVEREIELMGSLQHPNVIQLYDAFEYQKNMWVILELVEGGELFDRVIDDDYILTEKACVIILRQLCQAMEFVHRNNIVHLDLKPENILLLTKEGNRIKIIDFGLARKYDPDKKLQVLFGTPEFVAPEVVNFDRISFATDMWSVGVICYVVLSGLSPFMGETDIETMANVTIAKYDFDDEAFADVSENAIDFISKLLVKDSSTRMTGTECLEHTWLKRQVRPQLAPKPSNVPPPKYKTTPSTPSPPPTPIDEIEIKKDNLRNFVERWGEHPNSPYIFESNGGSNFISPPRNGVLADSCLSSRACSPSPCESLTSTTETLEADNEVFEEKPLKHINETTEEEVEEATEETKKSNSDKDIKDYLQSFERRNSDSKYVMKKTSSLEKINLADEIRKLSDRLLMLSNMKTELGLKDDEINNNDLSSRNNNDSPKPPSGASPPKKPEIKKKPEFLTKNSKLNETFNRSINISESSNSAGSRFMRSSSVINNSSSSSSMESSYTKFSSIFSKKSNSFSEKVNKALDETMKLSSSQLNGVHHSESIPISRKSSFSSEFSNADFGSAPWPVSNRRTKFRLTGLSRDVPVGSPNTHQNIFMEEAASATKDCLLHLLERYSDREDTGTISKGRHQSISVDWGMGISDNMEHRSMNSINAFFHRNSSNVGSSVKKLQSKIEAKNKH